YGLHARVDVGSRRRTSGVTGIDRRTRRGTRDKPDPVDVEYRFGRGPERHERETNCVNRVNVESSIVGDHVGPRDTVLDPVADRADVARAAGELSPRIAPHPHLYATRCDRSRTQTNTRQHVVPTEVRRMVKVNTRLLTRASERRLYGHQRVSVGSNLGGFQVVLTILKARGRVEVR